MLRSPLIAAALACCAIALPAAAQYGRVERSQAEIALENAKETFAEQRAARQEANTACAARDYEACVTAGDSYRKGTGGTQDYGLALKAYERACKGDNGKGCATLAYMTMLGRGMDADPVKARSLYKESCDLDEVSGCAGYGNMLFTGTGGAKNVPEGTRILQDACNRDYEWACTRLDELGAYDPDSVAFERLKDMRGG
jgi:TPR repeat protein